MTRPRDPIPAHGKTRHAGTYGTLGEQHTLYQQPKSRQSAAIFVCHAFILRIAHFEGRRMVRNRRNGQYARDKSV